MGLSGDDVIQILKFIDESKFDELHLEIGDLKLIVSKRGNKTSIQRSEPTSMDHIESIVSDKPASEAMDQQADTNLSVPSETDLQDNEVSSADILEEEGLIPIVSPMLGIFYRAPKPGASPFVEVGTSVTENDTVCIIEVMKLFSSIKAGVRGRIVKICVENGQMVEFKQTLFLIEPEENLEKSSEK